ncbi:hypothetical protein BCR44DRAFT_53612 [Catenaria anguillulae PL171]|uniref:Myosin-binding domain-containing protein n=1 Tax=Catenaria anguillulae PL171 TaxID=765915 RepID=A0A1Y2HR34_9FUNG|nr:hypothetical protein BCR44DRAFT_53612 [Catenaria anguillulae PL171]
MESTRALPPNALSIADPILVSESPLAQYLADAGLDDEVDATITLPAVQGGSKTGETIHATNRSQGGSERRWRITAILSIGGGIVAVSLAGWMGWAQRLAQPIALPDMKRAVMVFAPTLALASFWGIQRQLTSTWVRHATASWRFHGKTLDVAWISLDKALTSRYRYLREVDLVSRGYKLQTQALPSAWAADSFRKLDHRKLLVSCLDSTARAAVTALADLPNAPALDSLLDAVDRLVSDATTEYSLAGIKDLLIATRELICIVLDDAELVSTPSLSELASTLESVTLRLTQSDPFSALDEERSNATSPSSAAPAAVTRSNPTTSTLAQVHAHLHTMHIKTHLALTEAHDDPIALAAYLTAMPGDIEHLTSLLAHLRMLADGPQAAGPPSPNDGLPEDDAGDNDATLTRASAGRVVTAEDDMGNTLDAEAWTGEVDLQDEGELTVRPRSTLTREERIALRKQQLAEQAAARVAASSTLQFVGELKNVLGQRQGNVN